MLSLLAMAASRWPPRDGGRVFGCTGIGPDPDRRPQPTPLTPAPDSRHHRAPVPPRAAVLLSGALLLPGLAGAESAAALDPPPGWEGRVEVRHPCFRTLTTRMDPSRLDAPLPLELSPPPTAAARRGLDTPPLPGCAPPPQ